METELAPDSIVRFRQYVSDLGKGESTIRGYSTDLRMLLSWSGETSLPATEFWTKATKFLLEPGNATATNQRRLASFSVFARWAEWPGKPLGFQIPEVEEQEAKPLPGGMRDVRKMADACVRDDEVLLVLLCGRLGLRVSEAVGLTADCVDPVARKVRVVGKGKHVRRLPPPDDLWAILHARALILDFQNVPLIDVGSDDSARHLISRIGVRAGLGRVASHRLRHTFATALWNKTKNALFVQKFLGHKDLKTTLKYLGVDTEEMRAAAVL